MSFSLTATDTPHILLGGTRGLRPEWFHFLFVAVVNTLNRMPSRHVRWVTNYYKKQSKIQKMMTV